jgi:hypothetical protein
MVIKYRFIQYEIQCEGKTKLRSHNTSYCLIELVTRAGLIVVWNWQHLLCILLIQVCRFDLSFRPEYYWRNNTLFTKTPYFQIRGPKMSKEFFFVCWQFKFQPILMNFSFIFLIKFSLFKCDIPTDIAWLLLFFMIQGGQSPKI